MHGYFGSGKKCTKNRKRGNVNGREEQRLKEDGKQEARFLKRILAVPGGLQPSFWSLWWP